MINLPQSFPFLSYVRLVEDFQAMAMVIAPQTGIQLDLVPKISSQVVDTMTGTELHLVPKISSQVGDTLTGINLHSFPNISSHVGDTMTGIELDLISQISGQVVDMMIQKVSPWRYAKYYSYFCFMIACYTHTYIYICICRSVLLTFVLWMSRK